MGVKAAEVEAQPRITHILDQVFKKGISEVIVFLKASHAPEARKFLELWVSFSPHIHKKLPFEAFCLAAGLTTKRMLEILVTACYENAHTTVQLIAAVNQPKVVAATVKGALNVRYGSADRKMLHTASGFTPISKNQTMFFARGAQQLNQQNNVDQSKHLHLGEGEGAEPAAITENKVTYNPNAVHDIESRMNRIADRFNQRIGLLPAKEEAEVLEAETIPTVPEADWE